MDTRVVELLEACYGEELSVISSDLGVLEQQVTILVRQWGQTLLQRIVDKGPRGYTGSHRPCSCGGWSRFVGYRGKSIHTTVGWIELRRAYYHCSTCGTGEYPYDQAGGLGSESLSAALAKACCTLAVASSFAESSRMIQDLFGQAVSANTIERLVQHVGSTVTAQDRQSVEACFKERLWPRCDTPTKRLYLAADGTTVHERDGWHESKVGCLWWEDPQGRIQHRYVAGFEDAQRFGQSLWWQACRCGLRQAAEIVYLGDGAAWVRGLHQRHWPRAVFIVDWYHAQEHLWNCAKVLWGEGTEKTAQWARRGCGWLWEGWTRKVLAELARQRKRHRGRKRKAIEDLSRYIRVNEQQMRYDVFRAKGYSIGSGMVEGACKHVVGDRLKRSGMIWSRAGSSATLALRICWLNEQWDQLWQQKPLAA